MLILILPTEAKFLILYSVAPAVNVAALASNVGETAVEVFENRTITLVIGPKFDIVK